MHHIWLAEQTECEPSFKERKSAKDLAKPWSSSQIRDQSQTSSSGPEHGDSFLQSGKGTYAVEGKAERVTAMLCAVHVVRV